MDYFEKLVKTLLESEGYWVFQGYKVELTKEDKQWLGNPSIPRPEIDLVAYRAGYNELLAIEVKSFLDSPGVDHREVCVAHESMQGRYKLFTSSNYRDLLMLRLHEQLAHFGSIPHHATPRLCLAAGNIKNRSLAPLTEHFRKQQWRLITPSEIKEKLSKLAGSKYANDPTVLAAKMLLR